MKVIAYVCDESDCRESLHLPNDYRCSLSILSLSQICSHIHPRHFRLIAETLFTCYTSTYFHLRFLYPHKNIHTYICNSTNSSPRACLSAKNLHMLNFDVWTHMQIFTYMSTAHICLQLIKHMSTAHQVHRGDSFHLLPQDVEVDAWIGEYTYMRGYIITDMCMDVRV